MGVEGACGTRGWEGREGRGGAMPTTAGIPVVQMSPQFMRHVRVRLHAMLRQMAEVEEDPAPIRGVTPVDRTTPSLRPVRTDLFPVPGLNGGRDVGPGNDPQSGAMGRAGLRHRGLQSPLLCKHFDAGKSKTVREF